MKKIKLNVGKLHLKKEKITNLTNEEMNKQNGGVDYTNSQLFITFCNCLTSACTGPSSNLTCYCQTSNTCPSVMGCQ